MSYTDGGSFLFGTTDMYDTYGLKIHDVLHDTLKPPLRQNFITIPHHNGVVDFGAKWYDQRSITLRCMTTRTMSRAEVREMAYTLSTKSKIYLFNEPDKYYIGQLYDAPALDYSVNAWWAVDLAFLCDPFAYGQQVTAQFTNSSNLSYAGTAPTPTIITITNNNSFAVDGVTITMREVV